MMSLADSVAVAVMVSLVGTTRTYPARSEVQQNKFPTLKIKPPPISERRIMTREHYPGKLDAPPSSLRREPVTA